METVCFVVSFALRGVGEEEGARVADVLRKESKGFPAGG